MFEAMNLLLPEDAFDGPMQMALDEVLLARVSLPTLRIYRWTAPCVTFGYFQHYAEVCATHPSMSLVRRRTGGGMVEHGSDVTFSLMIPRSYEAARISPALFYQRLHHALAKFLTRLGEGEVRLAGGEEVLSGPSCFSAPAMDDLLCQGRKILGGAQCRTAGALLYQGSLQGMRALEEKKGFFREFGQALSERISEISLKAALVEDAIVLAQSRYASAQWNERR
jgi:lipoyl(octanoyl) transferase